MIWNRTPVQNCCNFCDMLKVKELVKNLEEFEQQMEG